MDDHSPDPRCVEEFVDLAIVREQDALLAESTPVADGNEKAVTGIDGGGRWKVDALADVHTSAPEPLPAILEAHHVQALLDCPRQVENGSQDTRPNTRWPCFTRPRSREREGGHYLLTHNVPRQSPDRVGEVVQARR